MIKPIKITAIFVLLSMFIPLTAMAAPKIAIDQPNYNAGSVPQGLDIIHDFTIKNIGDEPLTVKAKPC